eukprot:2886486-Amphidinium_carterae.3
MDEDFREAIMEDVQELKEARCHGIECLALQLHKKRRFFMHVDRRLSVALLTVLLHAEYGFAGASVESPHASVGVSWTGSAQQVLSAEPVALVRRHDNLLSEASKTNAHRANHGSLKQHRTASQAGALMETGQHASLTKVQPENLLEEIVDPVEVSVDHTTNRAIASTSRPQVDSDGWSDDDAESSDDTAFVEDSTGTSGWADDDDPDDGKEEW